MNQARRAAPQSPRSSLRDIAVSLRGPRGGERPSRALIDPDEPQGIGARATRLLVPGVAASVVAVGTVGVVLGSQRTAGLEAVPAAAIPQDIALRNTSGASRSEQRLLAPSETPSATAMASATPSATPSASSTPSPTPSATKASTPKASSLKSSASPQPSGSVANCPKPSGWLGANAQRVYEVSCQVFSYVTAYGGSRDGDPGPHGTGHALDIMIGDSTRGWDIANYMRAHASSLGITEVIYQQKIWTTQRSSEGWRPMEDRGSPTANHMDHVHVTVS
ncbi:hypothetical protein [Raineyella fluvialis]|uniref:ARB-07466-like C-terminal domain-containing protein n=1 Tax=Raineyella fluvialis TaxID=2662261 RepID=A0A5Q2FAA6_9ACTN|nr:hypothetical protein [Raineyella fluvialis]QGF23618.1 hypothetical protein Rai3103_07995 [Raineyella fluvialis]